MGGFTQLIEHMEQKGVPEEIIKEAEEVFDNIDSHLKEYSNIHEFSQKRWEELGKPLSLEAHQAKKKKKRPTKRSFSRIW